MREKEKESRATQEPIDRSMIEATIIKDDWPLSLCRRTPCSTADSLWQGIFDRHYATASSSHLRTMLPESISRPKPAKWPNRANKSLFDSKSLYRDGTKGGPGSGSVNMR